MKICKNCGLKLDHSDVEGYSWVCRYCDENFYDFETHEYPDDTYRCMSFHYNSDFDHTPSIIVRIPGIVFGGTQESIAKAWETRWDELQDTLNYPDSDEEVVVAVLEDMHVPHEIVRIDYFAEY